MALNSLVGVVRHKLSRYELAAVVHAEHTELPTTLLLHGYLVALDGVYSSCLGVKQHGPHVVGVVVNKQHEERHPPCVAGDTRL